MREIIFRGRTAKGEWVYGYHAKFRSCKNEVYSAIIPKDEETGEAYMEDLHPVIPETVGQYTGITDKNGKKIFEGDIVKMSFIEEGEEWEPEYLTVYWDDKVNGFLCHSNQTTMSVDSDFLCDGEVVGNIHDNPELVEVEACRM